MTSENTEEEIQERAMEIIEALKENEEFAKYVEEVEETNNKFETHL